MIHSLHDIYYVTLFTLHSLHYIHYITCITSLYYIHYITFITFFTLHFYSCRICFKGLLKDTGVFFKFVVSLFYFFILFLGTKQNFPKKFLLDSEVIFKRSFYFFKTCFLLGGDDLFSTVFLLGAEVFFQKLILLLLKLFSFRYKKFFF